MGGLRLVNFLMWCLVMGCVLFDSKVKSDSSCDTEISETLRTLLNPQEDDSIQVQALRRQLLRRFQEDLDLAELEDEKNYKRNLASLAAWNNLPDEHKRNVEALARSGTWYKYPPEMGQLNEDDDNYKRSIANLAKNDQLPLMQQPIESQKRGIEALARNGDLIRRQNYQDYRALLEALYDKRSVGSLARNYNFPNQGYGKRSVSSLAKQGILPYVYGKRNIQSLARDGQLGKRSVDNENIPLDKRNIQSIKAKQRTKRQIDYHDSENVYQFPPDYEDLLQELSASEDFYPVEDKRFLGSVAKTGWFQPNSYRRSSSFTSLPEKRHVAALARLGWLPSYRSVRRFSRSGRSYFKSDDPNICRSRKQDPSNGKTQNYSYTKITSIPLDTKRYLLQPAVDNILLKKQFRHPRMIV